MAEIQMTIKELYCEKGMRDFCLQCVTQFAKDVDCKCFDDGHDLDPNIIPYGNCIHCCLRTKHKGITVKNYEIEDIVDVFNPVLTCAVVKTRNTEYYCEKVILDGECIYPHANKNDE